MIKLPAEWERQERVLLSFPPKNSDWTFKYEEAKATYKDLIRKISPQKVTLIVENKEEIQSFLLDIDTSHVDFFEYQCNDTWIRDYGVITALKDEKVIFYDFQFNGWGGKFDAELDNGLSKQLYPNAIFQNLFIEGGAIETDGLGTLLATEQSIINSNRSPHLSKEQIEKILKETLGFKRFFWLKNGDLVNDDTDAHIDMLARFVNPTTIVYAKCEDTSYEHYQSLKNMESELGNFKTFSGKAYKLIPLPLPTFKDDGDLTPATYTNFLITNDKVLIPSYGVSLDSKALEILQPLFPERECVLVDSRTLITQGGAIHCATMNLFDCKKI